MRWLMGMWGALTLLCVGVGCGNTQISDVASGNSPGVSSEAAAASENVSAPSEQSVDAAEVAGMQVKIGTPKNFENLTVFPILASAQVDPGPLRTLASALGDGSAVVRELGADGTSNGDAAEVGRLVVENRGAVPIYVLAGTVVKGGKQDRQIGQDFVIPGKKTVEVDAFCVEHGRWNAERDGSNTGGEFQVVSGLADTKVRAAAQYKSDQGQVWEEVAKVNASNQKGGSTGTLLATLDDEEVRKHANRLAEQATGHLASVDRPQDVVGVAYAVDGKIRAVRWFSHKKVFGLFEQMLVQSAAIEAITAQGGAAPKPAPSMAPAQVTTFMSKVDAAAKAEEKASEGNVNRYKFSDDAASSEVYLPPAASPEGAAKPKPAAPIGKDYSAY